MAIKKSLSLRYKILIFFSLITAIILTLYVGLVVIVFEQDKEAYVHTMSSSITKTLALQSKAELNSVMTLINPSLQEFAQKNKFDEISKNIFLNSDSLQWLAIYEKKNIWEKIDIIEKEPNIGTDELSQFNDLNSILEEQAKLKSRTVRTPFRDSRALIIETFNKGEQLFAFILGAKFGSLYDGFKSPSEMVNYLVNKKGMILFSPVSENKINYLSEHFDIGFFQKNIENKKNHETSFQRDFNNEELLVSYSTVHFADLYVISLLPKSEVLRATAVLYQKSIIFFFLLISGTIILTLFVSRNLTSSLFELSEATQKVAEGKFDIRVGVRTYDEVGILAQNFNKMAAEVSRLMIETQEKGRMESELKMAQTVQETLFPSPDFEFSPFYLAGYYEPASECGGDWWHYSKTGDKIYLWIGDATGHGASAALITSAARSAATILEALNLEPYQIMELLNRSIYDVSKGKLMMTFFVACIDLKLMKMTYSNASHEFPYLVQFKTEVLKKKDLFPLTDGNNLRLGQDRYTKFTQATIKINSGDRLFFYTDGLLDVKNKSGKTWGEREFIKTWLSILNESKSESISVAKLRNNFISIVNNYRQKSSLIDDITFFICGVS